ncbi:hypothetical protein M218_29140 [Burkholderia pseudomallei MSHR338]|nr:hypothetical protein M218_29140 [Burkholderia pseudomallei MSHR338]
MASVFIQATAFPAKSLVEAVRSRTRVRDQFDLLYALTFQPFDRVLE